MEIKLITGYHLTALDKRMIKSLITAHQDNENIIWWKTKFKKVRIVSKHPDGVYDITISENDTDMWGKPQIREWKHTIKVT